MCLDLAHHTAPARVMQATPDRVAMPVSLEPVLAHLIMQLCVVLDAVL